MTRCWCRFVLNLGLIQMRWHETHVKTVTHQQRTTKYSDPQQVCVNYGGVMTDNQRFICRRKSKQECKHNMHMKHTWVIKRELWSWVMLLANGTYIGHGIKSRGISVWTTVVQFQLLRTATTAGDPQILWTGLCGWRFVSWSVIGIVMRGYNSISSVTAQTEQPLNQTQRTVQRVAPRYLWRNYPSQLARSHAPH